MARREWTVEEEKYMNKYYLRQPTKRTAKALNRSIESVRKKAVQMRINTYYDGYLKIPNKELMREFEKSLFNGIG